MALTTYHHGITRTESSNVTPIIKSISMSTIALVTTSIDADDTAFPIDTPVLLSGITTTDLTNSGAKDTLMHQCLRTIKTIQNTSVVVLRLADPIDVDKLDLLLTCQTRLGVKPKIIVAPEIDTPAMARKLAEIAKKNLGFAYVSPRMDDGTLITVKEDIVVYRKTFSAREISIIEGGFGMPVESNSDSSGEVGSEDGNGSTDATDSIIPAEFNFDELPFEVGVKINNTSLSSRNAFFAIDINGLVYNIDKTKDITVGGEPWNDLLSISFDDNNNITIKASVAERQRVRLIPSDAQKMVSDDFVVGTGPLYGTGAIGSDGSFYFNIFAQE